MVKIAMAATPEDEHVARTIENAGFTYAAIRLRQLSRLIMERDEEIERLEKELDEIKSPRR